MVKEYSCTCIEEDIEANHSKDETMQMATWIGM
jgi:hypothetical protein